MKRIIKITEKDLSRIVKRVINEQLGDGIMYNPFADKTDELLDILGFSSIFDVAKDISNKVNRGTDFKNSIKVPQEVKKQIGFSTDIYKMFGIDIYTVKSGDNLTSIGKKLGTTADELSRINKLKNPDLIHSGDKLIYIKKGTKTSTPTKKNFEIDSRITTQPGDKTRVQKY